MCRIYLAALFLASSVALAAPLDGGRYRGVAPGAQALPPRAPRLPLRNGPERITWTGFQVQHGVPTVFVETTSPPAYFTEELPGMLIVTLKDTVVPLRNNRRPLDVSAFGTRVERVEMAKSENDLRVIIKTRGSQRPIHHETVDYAAGGFHILVISLPPG